MPRGTMIASAVAVILVASQVLAGRLTAATAPVLPRGFHASVYAQGLTNPTAMSVGPDGRLYVAEASGSVVAVSKAGIRTVVSNLATPLGLAWHAGKLYVSYTGSVATLTPSRTFSSFSFRVIISGLPNGRHQNDGMAFNGPWMYLGVGSTCNACIEADRRSASIMRFHLNGSSAQVYARGLRNPYGLAIRPQTGTLYATDNGRDDYDDQVPDELNLIIQNGSYGWPDCWGRGQGSSCSGTVAPVVLFEPHASADGLVFYTGHSFPSRYRGDAFVTEFGQTVGNGSNGHRVKDVHFTKSAATVSDFAVGLANPLAIAVAPDGALLIGDYGTGIVWKLQADGH